VSLAVCVSACGTGAGCPLSCTEEQANVLLFFFFFSCSGCLTQEKIVAGYAKCFIVIADYR